MEETSTVHSHHHNYQSMEIKMIKVAAGLLAQEPGCVQLSTPVCTATTNTLFYVSYNKDDDAARTVAGAAVQTTRNANNEVKNYLYHFTVVFVGLLLQYKSTPSITQTTLVV
ncbi:unnamed protein product [Ceratitis capitata]|uniref:(Mediterranean fruit fly) hypothetical protein n=1 Tax=Ceratitis capitata TaxID=7213 RepID=A0A811UV77_CERCA|nr:unnamed protein product [Ceratitis capitata]